MRTASLWKLPLLLLSTAMLGASATSPLPQAPPLSECNTPTSRFCDAAMPVPASWRGPVFKLSQDYPDQPGRDVQPWRRFRPDAQPNEYLLAVLGYVFDGNIRPGAEQSFDVANNPNRRWYHAPWQDFGMNGREFIHGLTRERTSEPFDLHPQQRRHWQNYAVGFYNQPGGYTIGQVWRDHGRPDPRLANFPEGTVAAKLLFTTAPISEVPFLRGAPEWSAYVYANPNVRRPRPGDPRRVMRVRLLQVDIAVKDSRGTATGWVFGTFVYGGGLLGQRGSGWWNLEPVGLMWGNDPGYVSGPFREARVRTGVITRLGWQGRLNGPVDNPASSCLSCHATAQYPQADLLPPTGSPWQPWFRNIPSGQPFAPPAQSTDYSLQLSTGIANFYEADRLRQLRSAEERRQRFRALDRQDPRSPREGGKHH